MLFAGIRHRLVRHPGEGTTLPLRGIVDSTHTPAPTPGIGRKKKRYACIAIVGLAWKNNLLKGENTIGRKFDIGLLGFCVSTKELSFNVDTSAKLLIYTKLNHDISQTIVIVFGSRSRRDGVKQYVSGESSKSPSSATSRPAPLNRTNNYEPSN